MNDLSDIAGLHVTSQRPCLLSQLKRFCFRWFHVNSSKGNFIVSTTNMTALSPTWLQTKNCKDRSLRLSLFIMAGDAQQAKTSWACTYWKLSGRGIMRNTLLWWKLIWETTIYRQAMEPVRLLCRCSLCRHAWRQNRSLLSEAFPLANNNTLIFRFLIKL